MGKGTTRKYEARREGVLQPAREGDTTLEYTKQGKVEKYGGAGGVVSG